MNMEDIISRDLPPRPWAEGEKIPWDDPEFSKRMLKEHLSQQHDMASRRQSTIDRHVAWIYKTCLNGSGSRILDLGCGPGFYSQRLAQIGHDCVGIDFSPASIDYARSQAAQEKLTVDYVCADIRNTEYGHDFDLAMLVFGEFNVFTRADAQTLLAKMHASLKSGGRLLIEPQTFETIEMDGRREASWHTESSGLFSTRPHLWLEEHFWHAEQAAATTRYFIVDSATGHVDEYASTTQAYADNDLKEMLTNAGFSSILRFASLSGTEDDRHEGLSTVTAIKT